MKLNSIYLLLILSFSFFSCNKSNDTSNRTTSTRIGWSCKINGVLHEWWYGNNNYNINDIIATIGSGSYAIATLSGNQILLEKKYSNGDGIKISIQLPTINIGTYTLTENIFNTTDAGLLYTSNTTIAGTAVPGASMVVKITSTSNVLLEKTTGEFSGTVKTSNGTTINITEGKFVAAINN